MTAHAMTYLPEQTIKNSQERATDLAQAERLAGLERTKFATGTLVQLRSGGPAMTVTSRQRNDDLIVAQWFDGAKLMQETFDPESLAPYLAEMKA